MKSINKLIRRLHKTRREASLDCQLTMHRRKQTAHFETEEKFHKLCEAAFEGIILMEEGVVLMANEQFSEMFGYQPSELVGMKVIDFFTSKSRELVRQRIALGQEDRYEVDALRKDGTVFPLEVRGKQVLYGGRNVRVKAVRDLSEQKQQEREWRNIFSMFAHDMKNPLVASKGILSRVLAGKTGPLIEPQNHHLQMVKSELTKLEKLILNFLEYSRLGAKAYTPMMDWLDVFSLMSESVERARVESEKKGLIISCEFDDFPQQVWADRGMIQRVIDNLLENAIKHTNSGGSVSARVSGQEENLFVNVADTGTGIAEHHLPFIFDAFYKANQGSDGSGLGLAIAHNIIRTHGGHIWAESIVGKGSAFSFILPIKPRTDKLHQEQGGNH